MKKIFALAVFTCALTAAGLGFASDQTDNKESIKIALIAPMSGSVASFGEISANAVKSSAKNINDKGGILGRQINIEIIDDACDPKQAVTVANKIIADKIKFVVGASCSGATLATKQAFSNEDILMLSSFASNPAIADGKQPNIFRVWSSDEEEAGLDAKYIAGHYDTKGGVAIIDDKQTYSESIANLLAKDLVEKNIKVVMHEKINAGEKDFSSVMTRVMDAKPSLLFYSGYQVEAGLIVRQLRDAGSQMPIMAATTISAPDFFSIAGEYGNGVKFASVPLPEDVSGSEKLTQLIKSKKIPSDSAGLYAYITMEILADAMNKAGSLDPQKVGDVLHHQKLSTIVGDGQFDSKGGYVGPPEQVYEWRNGKVTKATQ